ncbi:hypothetical protein D3C76_515610 [compost metagenome]
MASPTYDSVFSAMEMSVIEDMIVHQDGLDVVLRVHQLDGLLQWMLAGEWA